MNLAEAQALRYGAQKVKVYPDWIKCEDKLPERSGVYLVRSENGTKDGAIHTHWGSIDWNDKGDRFFNWSMKQIKISHWMPLPPAP